MPAGPDLVEVSRGSPKAQVSRKLRRGPSLARVSPPAFQSSSQRDSAGVLKSPRRMQRGSPAVSARILFKEGPRGIHGADFTSIMITLKSP